MKTENATGAETRAPCDLLAELLEIQDIYGYLPRSEISKIAEERNVPVLEVYAFARSEREFRLEAVSPRRISICFGTPWNHCASPAILAEFERLLGTSAGGKSRDGKFTLETVKCPGSCSRSPHVTIDGREVVCASVSDVRKILENP